MITACLIFTFNVIDCCSFPCYLICAKQNQTFFLSSSDSLQVAFEKGSVPRLPSSLSLSGLNPLRSRKIQVLCCILRCMLRHCFPKTHEIIVPAKVPSLWVKADDPNFIVYGCAICDFSQSRVNILSFKLKWIETRSTFPVFLSRRGLQTPGLFDTWNLKHKISGHFCFHKSF